jgi:glycosyltransferase involved in cell wall biosynthesis
MRIHYASFDAFPTSKGASTHIHHSLKALSEVSEQVNFYCLQGNGQIEDLKNVNIHSFYFDDPSENYLKRANLFAEKVFQCMELSNENGIAQFRDIWSGLGMINRNNLKTIFEVNALTSIELPVRFPLLTPSLIKELQDLEKKCLEAVNHIVTPSSITKNYLIEEFGIQESKISVIPNGASIETETSSSESLPENYLIYFGALQPWQGLDILLKSFKYLQDFKDLKLVICSSVKEKAAKPYQKLVENLQLEDKVIFKYELSKNELHHYIKNAKASIAPLKFGDRNLTQGCCPIKILESMACETPIIASDIPVCKELLNEENAYFFWPEDEQDLSRCIRFVLDNADLAKIKAKKAFESFESKFTWEHHNEKLKQVYQSLI